MNGTTYVVRLIGESDGELPNPKHFRAKADATDFAEKQVELAPEVARAEVWQVTGFEDPVDAIAAFRRGERRLVDAKCRRTAPAEIQRGLKVAFGRGPKAVLKFFGLLREGDAPKEKIDRRF